jgi:tRNA-specific 2-thiouridylase
LATGHYCRLLRGVDGEIVLHAGRDDSKDQSYFFAHVRRETFENLLFPLGEMTKIQVRALAQRIGLPNAERRDSQDICFLGGKISIGQFLDRHIEAQPGDIIDANGRVLGRHRGLFHYTLGQRKGIGVPSNCDFEKYVVIGKDIAKNHLIVAFESDRGNGIWTDSIRLRDINFLCEPLRGERHLSAKVRFRDPAVEALINFEDNGCAHVQFSKHQRALAPGQTLAFYSEDRLLGGGIYKQYDP